ncbi:DMSO/TMAO reductase YedYZ molybdopterin-dependent catalytic subunit [Nocardiopsis sp. Huas11]|uniref:molybdopterin-dependent oxidoreductase n=1 Tax=Nocardiopsis sp. Huas11 TaxID=2183912 RepID=UPI000EB33E9F|nr:molybdopterin-dependent oxidoreductase [Nocardiopsis sp. Huas11]RKS06532.1 DMSO/TMAO reductase YedYZ molybdopterin-dependent catalytic subunit [Nocardiopsis sp. Huas11]
MFDTTRTTPRLPAAVSGLVAGGAAVAVAEVVAVIMGRSDMTPLLAVGDAAVDLTPLPVKQFAVDTFGTADKLALFVGMGAIMVVAAALLGAAAGRRRWIGAAGIAAFAAVGLAAVLTRPGAGVLDTVPTLVGIAACYLLLTLLLNTGAASAPVEGVRVPAGSEPSGNAGEPGEPGNSGEAGEAGDGPGFDRRRFALLAGAAAAASAGAGTAARLFAASGPGTRTGVGDISLPRPSDPAAPLPDGADLELDGLSSFFTPNEDFYRIDTALSVPRLDASTWSLRIHGSGVEERTYGYDDLVNRSDLVERDITIACVSNPVGGDLIGNARWIGVPLAALLAEVGVVPPSRGGRADQLVSRSSDGMTIGTPVEDVMDGRDAMLALGMNGEPLPHDNGFPVRMVVPGLYGYVSACKWLVEIELTTFDAFDAYWVPRGWSARGPIKTQSRIETPRAGDSLTGGTVPIAGVAWAQTTGIDRVEVSVDGGAWHEAELAEEDTADTWRQWVYEWDAEPGDHEIAVRATDRDGATQTDEPAPVAPDGATGQHTVQVTVA